MFFYQLIPCKTNYEVIKPSLSDGKFNGLPDRGIGDSLKSLPCGVIASFVTGNNDFRAFLIDVKFKLYIRKAGVLDVIHTNPIKPILGLKCSSRKNRIGM